MKKTISIIVPSYNEENNIFALYTKVTEQFLNQKQYDYEIIFVNDGSNDNTSGEVEKIALHDSCVRLIEFSRNFNKEIAISAGYGYACGDAVVVIDADLQHPPELITEMICLWEKGSEVVIGVRDANLGASMIKKIGSYIFFQAMAHMGDVRLVYGETDFCLIDKKVVVEFRKLKERVRTTRCLIEWLGFKKEYIHFVAAKRNDGKSRYTFFKLCKFAISTLLMHSMAPFMFAGFFGFIISAAAAIIFFLQGFLKLPSNVIGLIIIFLMGVNLACLGVLFFYLNILRKEVIARPLYIVRRTLNIVP